MKIFVMVDMEGISGICTREHVVSAGAHYPKGREYLTADVNACVEGLFQGGATEVVVRDAHGGGCHFIYDKLDPRAQYVQGGGRGERIPNIAEMDGLVLLGYHAMAGTAEAVLEHTMSSALWQNFWLNGESAGEIAIDAGIGGDHDVPTIMVSGCDKACKEAEELLPGVHTAVVKQGLDCCYAQMLSQKAAHDVIIKTAAEAVKDLKNIKPFKPATPVKMKLELVERGRTPDRGDNNWYTKLDNRTFEVVGDTVEQAMWRVIPD